MPSKNPLSQQPMNRILDVATLANSPYEKIFYPQNVNTPINQSSDINKSLNISQKLSSPIRSSIPNENVLQVGGMQMLPQELVSPDDDTNFLGSLIAQGVAGIGTGLMGGSSKDIMNSANMFQYMRDQESSRNRAKLLMDPKSEESKKRREVYKKLGYNVPDSFSYTDLNDPTVLQTIKGQMEQSRLAAMPRGGIGVGGVGKESKEDIKNIQSFKDATAENNKFIKQLDEYSNLVKKIPATGGTFTSGASTIESAKVLRGKLLLQLKNIEKTGALDAGMIAIADQILGTPDYTRNEVVDAKTNQLKSAIQDDILTNAEKFGITGTAVFDDGIEYYVDKNKNPVMKVK
jgi:hypothetical protein